MHQTQVLMDIDRVREEGAPRKKIRRHLHESDLRNAAQEHGAKLDQLIAIACYRAEEIRAADEKREVIMELAMAGFEQNPFR